MASLKVTVSIDIPDPSTNYTTSWRLGPGNPHLMQLLGLRLGVGAVVEIDEGMGYLRWHTPDFPTRDEMLSLARKVSGLVFEINREIDELRLIYKVITEGFGKEVTDATD